MTSGATTLAERYVLESPLATGGMGRVWLARDEVLARPVAIKILHEHLAQDQEFVERFRREALAAARLTHPHIVAIYDTGSDESEDAPDCHYIVMEHCGGGTLAEARKQGPIRPERVAAIGRAVCEALDYAHRHGVIHRDVKPENVLVTEDGTLKVGDFGIAKAAFTGDITSTGSILGTVTYIAPEQAQGEDPDARSDIYALGIVLYELLTGRPPFAADTQLGTVMKHVREPPLPPRSIRAGIPRGLEAVILKAIEKDPQRRFSSAAEMGAALAGEAPAEVATSIIGTPAVNPEPAPTPVPGLARNELRWVGPVLGIVAVVALIALIVPQFFPPDDPGGSNGDRPGGAGNRIQVSAVQDFDPAPGDGSEHPEDVGLAADDDGATAWNTEDYRSPLGVLKTGVGLVIDLGEEAEVARVEIEGNPGTFELRVGESPPDSGDDLDLVGRADGAGQVSLDEPASGRYWLVWITSLPDETGSASISEVRFFGP